MGKVGKMGIRPISTDTKKDTYGVNLRSEESWSISMAQARKQNQKEICQVCLPRPMYTSPDWERSLSRCWEVTEKWSFEAMMEERMMLMVSVCACQAALEKAWSCRRAPTVASPLLGAGARGAPVGEAGLFNWVAEKFGQVLVFEANSIMVMEH